MPARIQIACEESQSWRGSATPCPYLDIPVPGDLGDPRIAEAVAAAGWTHDERGLHCRRHDPNARWLHVRLSTYEDIEPIPGLRLRLKPGGFITGGTTTDLVADAQLLLDPARFDIDEEAPGVWRAKPVGTDWPEAAT